MRLERPLEAVLVVGVEGLLAVPYLASSSLKS